MIKRLITNISSLSLKYLINNKNKYRYQLRVKNILKTVFLPIPMLILIYCLIVTVSANLHTSQELALNNNLNDVDYNQAGNNFLDNSTNHLVWFLQVYFIRSNLNQIYFSYCFFI